MEKFFMLEKVVVIDIKANGIVLSIGKILSINMVTPLRLYKLECKNGGLLNLNANLF